MVQYMTAADHTERHALLPQGCFEGRRAGSGNGNGSGGSLLIVHDQWRSE
jgi:hypothetical protein